VMRDQVPAVDSACPPIYSHASSPCHCRVLSWHRKEPVMKATTSLPPTPLPLTMTCLPVPPRFYLRPQLLTRCERFLTGATLATASCDLKGREAHPVP
jgi:hypothetical protein